MRYITNPVVSKLVCRECGVQIFTNPDVSKSIILAVEHEIYKGHKRYTIAMTLYGTRGGLPIKHTIAV